MPLRPWQHRCPTAGIVRATTATWHTAACSRSTASISPGGGFRPAPTQRKNEHTSVSAETIRRYRSNQGKWFTIMASARFDLVLAHARRLAARLEAAQTPDHQLVDAF